MNDYVLDSKYNNNNCDCSFTQSFYDLLNLLVPSGIVYSVIFFIILFV